MLYFECSTLFILQGTGITFSMLELEAFLKLIPELIAMAMRFNKIPTAYYEEKEYRVFLSLRLRSIHQFRYFNVSQTDDCSNNNH